MPRRPSAYSKTNRIVGRINKKTGEFHAVMGRPRGAQVRHRASWESEEYAGRLASRITQAPVPAPKDLIEQTNFISINAERCKRRFRTFVEGAWSVLEPDTPFISGWHIDAICDHLQAMEQDQLGDLLITVPPRRMKSLLASVFFPAWVWTRHPESRFLYGSYSASLATMHSVFTRRVIESEWYQARWASVFQMTSDQNVKTFYENDKTGFRISVGVGGSATGRGGRFICCDDPHNVKEAYSDTARQEAVDWWNKTMSTRVNPGAPGHRLVIMQRVHVKDVAGDVISKGSYVHLNLPSEFVPSKKTVVWITQPASITEKPKALPTTPGGEKPKSPTTVQVFWEDPREKSNDLLWASTITPEIITQAKRDLGPYDYAAQHQQDPVPIGGGIVKRAWWRYWVPPGSPLIPIDVETEDGRIAITPTELPQDISFEEAKARTDKGEVGVRKRQAFDEMCMSVDCTFKNTDGSDYVVIQIWGRIQARKYLLDQVRRRMGFQDTVKEIQAVFARWPRVTYKFIEDTANGPAVIDSLRAKIPGIHPINPQGGKVARVHAITHTVSAGDVYLPSPHLQAWVWDFLHEWDMFTPTGGGDYDDQVDSTSQALSQLEKRSSVVPMAVL